MSCEYETMPRVEAFPYSVQFSPPSKEYKDKKWKFSRLKGRVVTDEFTFDAPMTEEKLSLLKVRLDQACLNGEERKFAKALGRLVEEQLVLLFGKGADYIDESIPKAHKFRVEMEEEERQQRSASF